MFKWLTQSSYRTARRIVITIVGGTVCLIGVVLLVAPGPAFVVIPAGLGILGLEYAFARRWLAVVRKRISDTMRDQRLKRMEKTE